MPDFPESLQYIWEWFIKLNNTRQSGMAASPITYQEILAFCTLYEIKMCQWELDLIKLLDRVALSVKE
jgi:hypothetical protein